MRWKCSSPSWYAPKTQTQKQTHKKYTRCLSYYRRRTKHDTHLCIQHTLNTQGSMQSHTRTIFKHIGQMTWFFTLASMVYSILLSRISKVKSLTIVIIFNTILQMHNIFFTTRKCNIGSSVAGGNAGGKPCYLPFLSITVSSCQGRARGTAGRDKNWFQYFCSTDTAI